MTGAELGQRWAQPQEGTGCKASTPGLTRAKLYVSKLETSEWTLCQKYVLHTWDIPRKMEDMFVTWNRSRKRNYQQKSWIIPEMALRPRIACSQYFISSSDFLSNLMPYFKMNDRSMPFRALQKWTPKWGRPLGHEPKTLKATPGRQLSMLLRITAACPTLGTMLVSYYVKSSSYLLSLPFDYLTWF